MIAVPCGVSLNSCRSGRNPLARADPADHAVGLVEHDHLADADALARGAAPEGQDRLALVGLRAEVGRGLDARQRLEPDRLPGVVGDHRAGLLLVLLGLRAEEQVARAPARRVRRSTLTNGGARSRRERKRRTSFASMFSRMQVRDRHPAGDAGDPERVVAVARPAQRQTGPHGDPLPAAEAPAHDEARALAVGMRAQPARVAAAARARHADRAEPAPGRAAEGDLRRRAGGNRARRGVGADRRPTGRARRTGSARSDEGGGRKGAEEAKRHGGRISQEAGGGWAVHPSGPTGCRQTSPAQRRRRWSSRCSERRSRR